INESINNFGRLSQFCTPTQQQCNSRIGLFYSLFVLCKVNFTLKLGLNHSLWYRPGRDAPTQVAMPV
ncbi:MAG: hypothetical protein ABFD29_11815, partial [Anaerolineaceae bacterium]